jgi:hypothetical protein
MTMPGMPDMDAQGPFCIDSAAVVWTLARELVEQQHFIARLERVLSAIQAGHVDGSEEAISLKYAEKTLSDLVVLRWLWYSKTLPSIVAKFALTLEAHETSATAR